MVIRVPPVPRAFPFRRNIPIGGVESRKECLEMADSLAINIR